MMGRLFQASRSPLGGSGEGDVGVTEQGPKLSATLIDELATQRRQILGSHAQGDAASRAEQIGQQRDR
jgi:hypothetical protein